MSVRRGATAGIDVSGLTFLRSDLLLTHAAESYHLAYWNMATRVERIRDEGSLGSQTGKRSMADYVCRIEGYFFVDLIRLLFACHDLDTALRADGRRPRSHFLPRSSKLAGGETMFVGWYSPLTKSALQIP